MIPNYFPHKETQCKCGCGFDINPKVRVRFDNIRHRCGFALICTSGARCPDYNEKVGGVKNSLHKRGLAMDILWPTNSENRFKLLKAIYADPDVTGLGIYHNFVHVDYRGYAGMHSSFWTG